MVAKNSSKSFKNSGKIGLLPKETVFKEKLNSVA
jgi:hypothetical protein